VNLKALFAREEEEARRAAEFAPPPPEEVEDEDEDGEGDEFALPQYSLLDDAMEELSGKAPGATR